jgi:hypothetical protein
MNENQAGQKNLLDTTDCLEAVGVFRGWKNVLFVVLILCLLLLQISFWLVDRGFVKPSDKAGGDSAAAASEKTEEIKEPPAPAQAEQIKQAAEKVVAEPNTLAMQAPKKTALPLGINIGHIRWTIRLINGLLVLVAVLYCLSMLFSLKISLIGRLGGINHISRAFFLSLVMVILLLPWQIVFDGVIAGMIFTPSELVSKCSAEISGIFAITFHYLRFTGYWLLVMLLLIFSHLRSAKWTKATLRRLEVI